MIAYSVGREQWDTIVLSQSPTVSLLVGYETKAARCAERFLAWVCHCYGHLNNGETWVHCDLVYEELRMLNVKLFMNEMVRRVGTGGVYSSVWIARELSQHRKLKGEYTMGLYYQHVLLLGKISRRFDRKLSVERLWRLTEEQKVHIRDLENTRLPN